MQRIGSLHPAVFIVAVTVAGAAFGILLAVPTVVVAGTLVNDPWFRRLEVDERDPDDQGSGEKG